MRTTTPTPQKERCPKCGGQLLPAEHAEAVCMSCGYERNPSAGERARAALAASLGLDVEPVALDAIRRTNRADFYKLVVAALTALAPTGEGVRVRITGETPSFKSYQSARLALDGAGLTDRTLSVVDRDGWRYLSLAPRLRRKPRSGQQ